MLHKKFLTPVLFITLLIAAGCSPTGTTPPQLAELMPSRTVVMVTPTSPAVSESNVTATNNAPILSLPGITSTQAASPTSTVAPSPTATEVVFEVGREITIEYLRSLEISGSGITFEEKLADGPNYQRHLASYISEGNKIYGLLTIPFGEPPQGGFKAIVFNHGYIPPTAYRTTERYTAYVDYLARSGFVVFKIDYRGHGESQGEPSGSYFSPGYTIDAISAFKSLQMLDIIDPQGIGMWGHSMAGNLVLRAMLVEPDIQAGVIWAGAVYSYDDFVKYGIDDNTYRPPTTSGGSDPRRATRAIFDTYGQPDTQMEYWRAVSLTENIEYLKRPIQLHHAGDDPVVNIGYSYDLATVLGEHGKAYEFYTYDGGGHNLVSPYFDQAMLRTVAFFRDHLSAEE